MTRDAPKKCLINISSFFSPRNKPLSLANSSKELKTTVHSVQSTKKGLIFFKRLKDGLISHCERQPEWLASKAKNTSFSMIAPTVQASAWSSLDTFIASRAMARPMSFPMCPEDKHISPLHLACIYAPEAPQDKCTHFTISHTPSTRSLEEILKDALQPDVYCTRLYRQPIVWIT